MTGSSLPSLAPCRSVSTYLCYRSVGCALGVTRSVRRRSVVRSSSSSESQCKPRRVGRRAVCDATHPSRRRRDFLLLHNRCVIFVCVYSIHKSSGSCRPSLLVAWFLCKDGHLTRTIYRSFGKAHLLKEDQMARQKIKPLPVAHWLGVRTTTTTTKEVAAHSRARFHDCKARKNIVDSRRNSSGSEERRFRNSGRLR